MQISKKSLFLLCILSVSITLAMENNENQLNRLYNDPQYRKAMQKTLHGLTIKISKADITQTKEGVLVVAKTKIEKILAKFVNIPIPHETN